MKRQILLFIISLSVFHGSISEAQIVLNQNPTRITFRKIETPGFKIIFAKGYDSAALYMANTLQHIYRPVSASLGKYPRQIGVILQNRHAVSNGFVTITPRRSEFYTMPPQNYNFTGTTQWLDLLAVHEFRHVVQYDKAIAGLNKWIYYGLGNEGLGAASFLAVPLWFWEGDAVLAETALTPGGRGKIPQFDMLYRATLLEYGAFNYNKQFLRSFKHFVPNHYVLGYHFTTYLRNEHGYDIWDNITEDAFRQSLIPYPFSRAMKKHTGKYLLKNYAEMSADLQQMWEAQVETLPLTNAKLETTHHFKRYTDYNFPQALQNGGIIALKSGIGDIQRFVDLSQDERVVFVPGIMNVAGMLSAARNKIAWNEFNFNPRFRAENYSVIKIYDATTKELNTIGSQSQSRYSAAALSYDASMVATVHTDFENNYTLSILDALNGDLLYQLPNPSNDFPAMPRWAGDRHELVFINQTRVGKQLMHFNWEDKSVEQLADFGNENIGHPVMQHPYVLYNSPVSGIDNIYAFHLATAQRYQVTSRRFGAFNPALNLAGDSLYFNDFSAAGMAVAKMPYEPEEWTLLENIWGRSTGFYEQIIAQEAGEDLLESVPDSVYRSEEFPKGRQLLNVYGWGPKVTTTDRALTAEITSQDLLSNMRAAAGYQYDANESAGATYFSLSYQGIYPIIDIGGSIGNRNISTILNDTLRNLSWQEKSLNVGVRVPLLLTRSKYLESLNFSVLNSIRWVDDYNFNIRRETQLSDGMLNAMRYRVSYSRVLKRSQRDIYSRWGQTLFLHYQHTPIGGDFNSAQFAGEGNLFLPGLFRHHHIRLRNGYQRQQIDNYRFATPLLFPRGYFYTPYRDFVNGAVQYAFPIWYPDIAVGPFFNVQRIKADTFYDYGYGFADGRFDARWFQSVGVDLTADFNLLRHLPLFEAGVRISYVPEFNSTTFNLVVGSFGF